MPDKAMIYDAVDTLKSCGVPVCDAMAFRGIYTRLPTNLPAQKVTVKVHKTKASLMKLPKVNKVVDKKVLAADVKDHHKMSY